MTMTGWQELGCAGCGGKTFVTLVKLIYRASQGTTVKPDGYECVGCHKVADTATMIDVAKRAELETKIAELEGQRA